MNRAIDKTTLGYLGSDFQYKLVKCFMEEPGYFASIYSVVEQNAFTETLLRQYVGSLKDYYRTTGIVPSYETLAIVLKQKARMQNELEEWDELTRNLKDMSPEGTTIVEESATKFFKQQNMIKVANDILKKTQDGDTDHYDECLKMMEDAVHVGSEEEEAFNPYDMYDEVMRPGSDIPIPCGIDQFDDALNGGLYKGHIGLVLGPSGFGKTTFSTAVASFASTYKCDLNDHKGWKVLQFCFEDDTKAISKKHFSRITQIESKDLLRRENIEEARSLIESYEDKEMFKENLLIKKYKTGTKSVEDLRIYLKQLINKGFRPDLVILDYFECLKLIRRDRNETKWDLQESTMRQLEVLAEEFNVALWIMTQGNKESFGAEIVKMDQGGGSITKVQIGHVIVSIARSFDDIDNNEALIAILKNRQGKSSVKFKVRFNNGTSTISCELVDAFDSECEYQEHVRKVEEETRNRLGAEVRDKARSGDENHTKIEPQKQEKPLEKIPVETPVTIPTETPVNEPEMPFSGATMAGQKQEAQSQDNYVRKPVSDNGSLNLETPDNKEVKQVNVPHYEYKSEEYDPDLMMDFDSLENGVF